MKSNLKGDSVNRARGEALDVSFTQFFDAVQPLSSLSPLPPDHSAASNSALGDGRNSKPCHPCSPQVNALLASSFTEEMDLLTALKACFTCALCGRYFSATHPTSSATITDKSRANHDPVVIETCGHCFCFACIDVGLEHGCSLLSCCEDFDDTDEEAVVEDRQKDGWPWYPMLPGTRPPIAPATSARDAAVTTTTKPRGPKAKQTALNTRVAAGGVRMKRDKRRHCDGANEDTVDGDNTATGRVSRPATHRPKAQFACPLCGGPAFRWTLLKLPVMQELCATLDRSYHRHPEPGASEERVNTNHAGLLPGLGEFLVRLKRPRTHRDEADAEEVSVTYVDPDGTDTESSCQARRHLETAEETVASPLVASSVPRDTATQASVDLFPQHPHALRGGAPVTQHDQANPQRAPTSQDLPPTGVVRAPGATPPSGLTRPHATANTSMLPPPTNPPCSVTPTALPSNRPVVPDTSGCGGDTATPVTEEKLRKAQRFLVTTPPARMLEQHDSHREMSTGDSNPALLGASPPFPHDESDGLDTQDPLSNLGSKAAEKEESAMRPTQDAPSARTSLSKPSSLSRPSPTPPGRPDAILGSTELPSTRATDGNHLAPVAASTERASPLTPSPPQTLYTGYYRDLLYYDAP